MWGENGTGKNLPAVGGSPVRPLRAGPLRAGPAQLFLILTRFLLYLSTVLVMCFLTLTEWLHQLRASPLPSGTGREGLPISL